MPYGFKVKTAPTDPDKPVSVEQAKSACKITDDRENSLIEDAIRAATEYTEDHCGRKWLTTVCEMTLDEFPTGRFFELPRSPGVAVVSVKYQDVDDAQQTFAASNYDLDTYSLAPRVSLDRDSSWPTTRAGQPNTVLVEFTAGYGTAVSTVPWQAKLAIKQLVAHWYTFRNPVVSGMTVAEVPITVERLLSKLVVTRKVACA